jgi:hypothetical protein
LLGSYHGQHGTFDAAWGPSTQHCERSEAIQTLCARPLWIASSPLLAMTDLS